MIHGVIGGKVATGALQQATCSRQTWLCGEHPHAEGQEIASSTAWSLGVRPKHLKAEAIWGLGERETKEEEWRKREEGGERWGEKGEREKEGMRGKKEQPQRPEPHKRIWDEEGAQREKGHPAWQITRAAMAHYSNAVWFQAGRLTILCLGFLNPWKVKIMAPLAEGQCED